MKKKFLICPVRNQDPEIVKTIDNVIKDDPEIHYPKRDTWQEDPDGLRICRDNMEAIRSAEEVLVIWDGKSQGCLFDLGMAFALDKKINILSLPPKTEGKSFQNMIRVWEESQTPPF